MKKKRSAIILLIGLSLRLVQYVELNIFLTSYDRFWGSLWPSPDRIDHHRMSNYPEKKKKKTNRKQKQMYLVWWNHINWHIIELRGSLSCIVCENWVWLSEFHIFIYLFSVVQWAKIAQDAKRLLQCAFFQLNRKTFHTCVGKFQSERMSAMRRRRRNGV